MNEVILEWARYIFKCFIVLNTLLWAKEFFLLQKAMIHGENISWFFLAELQQSKIVYKRIYFTYGIQNPVYSIMGYN
jgi:hypothetical protein